eukprot:7978673-Pyramimonas_sp.AAC.1
MRCASATSSRTRSLALLDRTCNITSFYGSSRANNGKDALNIPESILLVCCIHLLLYNIASLYGSSCADNSKGALNTPELL